ncbi:MAG TPA: DNA recombination protein RmuC [Candidatus Magasanikbacteria bacterium]|jgi:DNA recombination protein RmuC|nr:DNA recombination protein RmuC [Candidatus Magasanikbacteria bacterium]HQF57352.1 DNA recombination protein RmuC [Candidatus Magasanikbacteria bacterium]HQL52684.1 DNA recombination protein RmuC [Candidatus Magasanikbacteria bacterium]
MQTILFIIILFGFIGAMVLLYIMYRKLLELKKPEETENNLFVMLQNQIQDLSRIMDQKITDTHKIVNDTQTNLHKTIQEQFGQSVRIITDVTEKLTKLDETNKQVVGVAEQLQGLENVLKNPKHRGVLGEYYLENVLKNVMPPGTYEMQYKFSDGDIVDAVIFVKDKIIPIDSKFSLENYNRIVNEKDEDQRLVLEKAFKQDLKNRIDETSKYIKPKENTMDFAFMFIPAEGIYYDLLINKVGAIKLNTQDLIEYAFKEKHVIIVSPTSFFAYLQTVMQGLRALQIEEGAKEIRKQVEQLGKHLLSYEEYLKKMGNNLATTVNMYNSAYKEFVKIDKDVVKITEGERSVEPLQLEKPTLEND